MYEETSGQGREGGGREGKKSVMKEQALSSQHLFGLFSNSASHSDLVWAKRRNRQPKVSEGLKDKS